jgi:hypothetical protein
MSLELARSPVSIARVFPSPLRAPAPAQPFVAATTGQRCEVKYWATEAQAAALLKQSTDHNHMDLDPYCVKGPQRNTSVYFDSPNRTFFEMHRTGAVVRYKLRVRTYDDPNGPAFLEVKCKAKSTTMKQRTTVTQEIGRAVVAGRIDAVVNDLKRTTALNDFLFLYHRHLVEPTLVVSAWRLALASSGDGGMFRLTFDRDIRYQHPRPGPLQGQPKGWIPIDLFERSGRADMKVLVEMKFVNAMPAWVAPAIAELGLRRTAFSKYVAAMGQDLAESDLGRMSDPLDEREDD